MTLPPFLLAAPTSAPSSRALMRDVTGGSAGVDVTFDARSAFDFMFSLDDDAASTDDTPAADRRWLADARAKLPQRLQDLPLRGGAIFAATFLVDRPEATDAAAFVELLRGLPADSLAKAVLADHLRQPGVQPLLERALAGDDAAIDELVGTWHEHKRDFLARILRQPQEAMADLIALAEAWLPLFREIEPRVAAIIERDVELRAADRKRLAPIELIEKTTNGIRWLSETGVRRVILAPSYFGRPYNMVFAAEDWRMFGYPVADEALDVDDPLAPPQAVVRLHRALGDDTRLRILRLLRDRDWYLSEIAERLELSKPTIKHHLALLRSAGLVTLIEEGGLSYYSLRRTRLDDASIELKRFLLP